MRRAATLLAALWLAGCAADTASQFKAVEAAYKAEGLLRTAIAPKDAPFTNADLERNFVEIALYTEYGEEGVELKRTEHALSRWEEPIAYHLVGADVTNVDRSVVRDLTLRLERLSGIGIEERREPSNANFYIFVLNEPEREAVLASFEEKLGPEGVEFQRFWTESQLSPCIAQTYHDQGKGRAITLAFIFIKAEISGIYRKSCFHEEIVQAISFVGDFRVDEPAEAFEIDRGRALHVEEILDCEILDVPVLIVESLRDAADDPVVR